MLPKEFKRQFVFSLPCNQPSPILLTNQSFWRAASGEFWVRFGATWFVVGGIFLSIGMALIVDESRYRSDGVTLAAVVTSKEQRGEDYRIDYRFGTPHGQVDGSSQVPFET